LLTSLFKFSGNLFGVLHTLVCETRAELPTGQVVAVKKLHQSEDGIVANLKAFTSEFTALTEVRVRNIVKVFVHMQDTQ
jgi:pyruvate-formate lyase-activating enzyme